jgi:tetratricopeptide (TPR) repeat protein
VYAAERAEAEESADDRRTAVRRVLEWYLHTANAAQRALYPQRHHLELPAPESGVFPLPFDTRDDALSWCDVEHSNLVAAVHRAADAGFYDIAWQLPIALGSFLALRFHWADKVEVEQTGIKSARLDQDQEGEFWLVGSLGETYSELHRFEEAIPCFQQSLNVARHIENRWGEASTLHGLGLANLGLNRFDEAKKYFNLASSVFHAINDQRGEAVTLEYLGSTLHREHQLDEAADHLNRALAIHQSTGDRPREAWVSRVLGLVHLDRGQIEQASIHLRHALAIYRSLGDYNYVAQTLSDIGDAYQQSERPALAHEAWQEALHLLEELQSPYASHVRDRLTGTDPNVSSDPT